MRTPDTTLAELAEAQAAESVALDHYHAAVRRTHAAKQAHTEVVADALLGIRSVEAYLAANTSPGTGLGASAQASTHPIGRD